MMKYTFCILICVCTSNGFTWKDCGGTKAIAHFRNITLTPDPLNMGRAGKLGATLILHQPVLPNSQSRLQLSRLMHFVGYPLTIKLGCVGDCNGSLCEYLHETKVLCDWLQKANGKCGCPLETRVYRGQEVPIQVPMLKYSSIFVQGSYRIQWDWFDPIGTPIACVSADINLK